jgi:enoyl-CoA hydratase/carnithine racemase
VVLSARRLTADDAMRVGLVSQVVEPDRLLDAALAKAEAILQIAPLAAGEMLGLIRIAMERELEPGLDAEHEALARLRRTADAEEGIRAFVEKRDPRFAGG